MTSRRTCWCVFLKQRLGSLHDSLRQIKTSAFVITQIYSRSLHKNNGLQFTSFNGSHNILISCGLSLDMSRIVDPSYKWHCFLLTYYRYIYFISSRCSFSQTYFLLSTSCCVFTQRPCKFVYVFAISCCHCRRLAVGSPETVTVVHRVHSSFCLWLQNSAAPRNLLCLLVCQFSLRHSVIVDNLLRVFSLPTRAFQISLQSTLTDS